MTPDHEVVVVGAGFAGIGAAIELRRAGIEDFVVLDRQDDVGGTWHANRYPGVAVDISAFSYSYAFEPVPTWSRAFPPGEELKAYADHCVHKYGIRPHLRLNTEVLRTTYDTAEHLWRIALGDGTETTARFVICATGWLTKPKAPAIEGLDRFKGDVVHTAEWDPSLDLDGRRVGLIGTGASAVQVVPRIAPRVERLRVYQRTPIWLLPKLDFALPEAVRRVFEAAPLTQRAVRAVTDATTEISFVIAMTHNRQFPFLVKGGEALSRRYLRSQVKGDRALMEKLTPSYALGCKRPSLAKGYWRTFTRGNVDLVTDGIEEITETGIRTADGSEHDLDVLVLATGFEVLENLPPFPMHGPGGRDLKEFWRTERFQAYEGSSVKGYPNLWFIVGPYSFTGGSWFGAIDYQVTHAVRVIREARRRRATEAAIRPEQHDRSFAKMLRRQRNTIFANDRCAGSNSYYFDERGDAPAVRPATTYEAAWRARHFDLDDYRFTYAPGDRRGTTTR
ncbi:monooxygenase [Streptomyces griseocarneus]|nr:monooxygenase [Streptomyces griseocarneus]